MAHYKVEICGINTSKLPLLSNEEKKELIEKIQKGDKKPVNNIFMETCVWYSASSSAFITVMRILMIYSKSAASDS